MVKHATLLDGLQLDGQNRSEVIPPTLLRYDMGRDTVQAFFADLKRPDWQERLNARAALEQRFGVPLVDQHIHRRAIIVVVDAACLTPGFPRLDPAKVAIASMVIRREVKASNSAPDGIEIWATGEEGDPLGWVGAPEGASAQLCHFEPDAALRRTRLAGPNKALALRTRITGDAQGVSETMHAMFPIPPDISAKIGRTLFFAMLPTTSGPVVPGAPPPPPFDLDDVKARVPNMLRQIRTADPLPPTGITISRDAARNPTDPALRALRSALTWLGQEAGMFTGEPYAASLRSALGNIAISGASQTNLRDWFDAANAIIIERRDDAPSSIASPANWPSISASQFSAIAQGGLVAMTARWSSLAPSVTRFGATGDRYHVRCFLRIDDHEGCPPRVLWSPLSRSYTIRPWFESGGAPPHMIEMPGLGNLAAMKPDVAIKVPPEIQQFMDRLNLENLIDGKAEKNLNISFGMICGFSIPIITICAFIVLQIFLQLLNILFFWLPFIKICIPFPIVTEEEE
jgi:hypothetical protein